MHAYLTQVLFITLSLTLWPFSQGFIGSIGLKVRYEAEEDTGFTAEIAEGIVFMRQGVDKQPKTNVREVDM